MIDYWARNIQLPATALDLLIRRGAEEYDSPAYTFLRDGEADESNVTYGDLDKRARAIGAWLKSQAGSGERVLLFYPQGLDFLAAFFGCLYGGVIAVPAYPPGLIRLDRVLLRLRSMVQDAQPKIGLTSSSLLPLIEQYKTHHEYLNSIRWVTDETVSEELATEWKYPDVNSDTVAFLQYTSGSTDSPKGVMVTHRNVLEMVQMIETASGYTRDSTIVGWVPFAHDLGLVGRALLSVYLGARSVFMSPEAFLQKPARWLRAISRYRSVVSAGPNFAYELCVRRITAEQRAQLDLTNWSTAVVASEPANPDTLERFATTFAPCGFRREAFSNQYGLAEATLLVTCANDPRVLRVKEVSSDPNTINIEPPENVPCNRLVSAGRAARGETVLVVDPQTNIPCPPDRIGEIWVSGDHVAQGYWNKPDETEKTFRAYLADRREGPFLQTGDLGFFHDSELFVTGRLKDLIIIRGRNYYPPDIESTMRECYDGHLVESAVAFSIEEKGEERLVLIQEMRNLQDIAAEELIEKIRRAVLEQHEVWPYGVVLVKSGNIPRTSSGKPQRRACRKAFLNGQLSVLQASMLDDEHHLKSRPVFVEPCTATEKKLAEIWRTILDVESIGIFDHFVDLGGQSALATRCLNRVRDVFSLELPLTVFFTETGTVAETARLIDELSSKKSGAGGREEFAVAGGVALKSVEQHD